MVVLVATRYAAFARFAYRYRFRLLIERWRGLASTLAKTNKPTIMKQTSHKSEAILRSYLRDAFTLSSHAPVSINSADAIRNGAETLHIKLPSRDNQLVGRVLYRRRQPELQECETTVCAHL